MEIILWGLMIILLIVSIAVGAIVYMCSVDTEENELYEHESGYSNEDFKEYYKTHCEGKEQ